MKCERCSVKDECFYAVTNESDKYINCPILENRLFVSDYKNIERDNREETK